MIGVCCREEEREAVGEFFELFKTPWELFREGERYSLILSTDPSRPLPPTRVVILYGSEPRGFDRDHHLLPLPCAADSFLVSGDIRLPVCGGHLTFSSDAEVLLRSDSTGRPAALLLRAGSRVVIRIGYDLFREIRGLLVSGQSVDYAGIPTLDMHIALLRSWILRAGVPVLEIPPSPAGTDFLVCLTHDVDFAGIRMHRFDLTLAGFLHRAVLGSAIDLAGRRAPLRKAVANWKAVLLLPAVYAGLRRDPWIQFERYLEIERGLKSTFFFIPFRRRAGRLEQGSAPARRACKYDISDVRPWAERIRSQGCEIGLHGIDAWMDASRGREELERIRSEAGEKDIGVRMHWLYLGPDSPGFLEKAGFLYDSTVGYNDAVGFRAGTGQVFRPSGARTLMELPLAIQDTALFYKGRMGLREEEALERCKGIIAQFRRFGGVLVINWHHRSLAPERLWGGFYQRLLDEIGTERVGFVTGREAVHWFLARRSARFERQGRGRTRVRVRFAQNGHPIHPGLVLRVNDPGTVHAESPGRDPFQARKYADVSIEGSAGPAGGAPL